MVISVELPFIWVPDSIAPEANAQIVAYALEIIHSHMQTLDFEGPSWAYLIPVSDSDFRIVQKPRPLYSIKISPWLPLVSEEEIVWKRWVMEDRMLGEWDCKEVVVDLGVNDRDLQVLERTMEGLLVIRDAGLSHDICFEPLAHVVRDGMIVGIVYEPPTGRMIDHRDRAIVTDLFWRLKENGLVWAPYFGWEDFEDISETYFHSSLGCYLMVDAKGQVRFNYDGAGSIRKWAPQPGLEPDREDYLPNEKAISFTFEYLKRTGVNSAPPTQLLSYKPITLVPTLLLSQVQPSPKYGSILHSCRCAFHIQNCEIVHIDTTGCRQHSSTKGRSLSEKHAQRNRSDLHAPQASMSSARMPNRMALVSPGPFTPTRKPNRRSGVRIYQESSAQIEELED
ncbi:hypothetical protein PQX77_000886 [Marasmius sp. AFHP31]|nr:hypothetical protein PQX77_000886 [Marasmius sp. AFHP31]